MAHSDMNINNDYARQSMIRARVVKVKTGSYLNESTRKYLEECWVLKSVCNEDGFREGLEFQ